MTTVAVPIEKEAKNFKVMSVNRSIGMSAGLHYELPDRNILEQLPHAKFTILGKLSELTNEQVNKAFPQYANKGTLVNVLSSEGKYCKWMAEQMPMFSSLPTQYQQLPDDFLILVKP